MFDLSESYFTFLIVVMLNSVVTNKQRDHPEKAGVLPDAFRPSARAFSTPVVFAASVVSDVLQDCSIIPRIYWCDLSCDRRKGGDNIATWVPTLDTGHEGYKAREWITAATYRIHTASVAENTRSQ
ncbi:hypothetical protein GCM10007086_43900 [Photobacterium aphoticum]|nr:hypothetical protein GCM10007086_43900 [Photobacterium aphoticum]